MSTIHSTTYRQQRTSSMGAPVSERRYDTVGSTHARPDA